MGRDPEGGKGEKKGYSVWQRKNLRGTCLSEGGMLSRKRRNLFTVGPCPKPPNNDFAPGFERSKKGKYPFFIEGGERRKGGAGRKKPRSEAQREEGRDNFLNQGEGVEEEKSEKPEKKGGGPT